jgi:hypothetical protein
VSVYSQIIFSNKFKYGQMTLDEDPEKHRGRQITLHTDENCVTVEGLLK